MKKRKFKSVRVEQVGPGVLCIDLWGNSEAYLTPNQAVRIGEWLIKWGKQYAG